MYSQKMRCFLQKDAYEKFLKAIKLKNLGYKFKIWDAVRPPSAAIYVYKFPEDEKWCGFFSNPKTGSIPHCRVCH